MTESGKDEAEDAPAAQQEGEMPSWLPGALPDDEDAGPTGAEAADAEAAEDAVLAASDEAEGEAFEDVALPEDDAPHAGAAPAGGSSAPASAPGAEAIVALAPKTRAADAEDLADQLRAAPAEALLVIDASKVEDISTPALAAIVAAVRSRGGMEPPAAVLAPTPAFVDAFSDLGLFQDLMKMEFRQ